MSPDDAAPAAPTDAGGATPQHEQDYAPALASVRHAIGQFSGCSDAEKAALAKEISDLEEISRKLEQGRVEIVLFGEIDTGKSALINALTGRNVAEVDVRGGRTNEVWRAAGHGSRYLGPRSAQSRVRVAVAPALGAEAAPVARGTTPSRRECALFGAPSTRGMSTCGAIALTASWRFCVA